MIVLPIRNNKTEQQYPPVTLGLIVLNVLLFLFVYRLDLLQSYDFLYSWGFSWHLFHPLTLITTQFLHANLVHLAGNMLFLWIFGPPIEEELKELPFLGFYLVGGIMATLIYSLTLPEHMVDRPLIGASGSIAAIMGLYFVLYPKSKVEHFFFLIIRFWTFSLPAWVTLGYWFLLQIYNTHVSAASPVAYYAHIGGFLFGFALGLYYKATGWHELSFENMTDMNAVRNIHDLMPYLDEPARITKFEEAIEQQPDNPELTYWYAVTALRQGKLRRAQQVARNITNRYPDEYKKPNLNAFLLYKRLDRTIRSTHDALRYAGFLEDIEHYEAAVAFLQDVLENRNMSTGEANRVRMRLGRILVDHLERYEEAYGFFVILDQTASDTSLRKSVDRKKRKLETFLKKSDEAAPDDDTVQ